MSQDPIDNEVSAGELRSFGVTVPPDIPDCACIRRSSIRFGRSNTTVDDNGSIKISVELNFTEPFRWVTGTYRVEAKHDPAK